MGFRPRGPSFTRTTPVTIHTYTMSSSTTMIRRGKPSVSRAPSEAGTTMLLVEQADGSALTLQPAAVAHVKRNFCGTGPFDRHWFNVDCCGIVCALFTYGLHAYGIYSVCFILIPPWMSYTIVSAVGEGDSTSLRYLSATGRTITTVFTLFAFLACAAHFKAMTTDPGAVPPDARPLPDPREQEESSETTDLTAGPNQESPINTSDATTTKTATIHQPQRLLPESSSATPSKARRLCRRCKAFKPQRAHHCSVCRRCIIKMDHHCPW
jgi:hypothetical protein